MKSAQKATGPEGTRPLLVTSFPCFRLLALMALGFLGRMNELDMVGQTRRAAPSRSGTSRGWSGGGGQGRRQELVIFTLGPKQVHRTRESSVAWVVRKTLASTPEFSFPSASSFALTQHTLSAVPFSPRPSQLPSSLSSFYQLGTMWAFWAPRVPRNVAL
jgi:hypothetical protein